MRLQSGLLARALANQKSSAGAGGSSSKMADTHGSWVSVHWQRRSLPVSFHQNGPLHQAACMPGHRSWLSKREPRVSKVELQCLLWPSLSSPPLSFLQSLFSSMTQGATLVIVGGACTEVWVPGGSDPWGSSCRLATTPLIQSFLFFSQKMKFQVFPLEEFHFSSLRHLTPLTRNSQSHKHG